MIIHIPNCHIVINGQTIHLPTLTITQTQETPIWSMTGETSWPAPPELVTGAVVSVFVGAVEWMGVIAEISLQWDNKDPRRMVTVEIRSELQSIDTSINQSWTNASAQSIIESLFGQSVTWTLPAWTVPQLTPGDNDTRLSLALQLIEEVGGVITATSANAITCRREWPIPTNTWGTDDQVKQIDSSTMIEISDHPLAHDPINRVSVSQQDADNHQVSLALDPRPDGYNQADVEIWPGRSRVVLAYIGEMSIVEADVTASCSVGAITIHTDGITEVVHKERIAWSGGNEATAQHPISTIDEVEYYGTDLGTVTATDNRITAAQSGVAVADITYRSRVIVLAYTAPADVTVETPVMIHVETGSDDDGVIAERGDGALVGDPIIAPLLSGVDAYLARGRNVIDESSLSTESTIRTGFRDDIELGDLVAVIDGGEELWRGQVVSIQHKIEAKQATIEMTVWR